MSDKNADGQAGQIPCTAPSQGGHAAGPACSAPGNDDTAEVLFALEMALEHDERHQALALKTWIPRIRLWASAADRELARLTKSASRAPDEALIEEIVELSYRRWTAVALMSFREATDWAIREYIRRSAGKEKS